jgi:hypothetical protein
LSNQISNFIDILSLLGTESTNRFDRINKTVDIFNLINAKIDKLESNYLINIAITTTNDEFPKLPSGKQFNYVNDYSEYYPRFVGDENITMAFLTIDEVVLGYGLAVQYQNRSVVELIDVDESMRVSSGYFIKASIQGQVFKIGFGHILAKYLIKYCKKPIYVDACRDRSEFIFKCLQFVKVDNSSAPIYILK